MSTTVIVILIYHCHKPIDIIYRDLSCYFMLVYFMKHHFSWQRKSQFLRFVIPHFSTSDRTVLCLVIEVCAGCSLVEERVNSVPYLILVLLSQILVSTLHVKCYVFSCVIYCWHSRNSLCVTCCSFHLNFVHSKMFCEPYWTVVQCVHFCNFVHLAFATRYVIELISHHNKFCKELICLFSLNVSSFI
jgi:hypothetical protein